MDLNTGANPTLVLVHGSWHSPLHFEPIIQDLNSQGYKCVNVALPSTQTPDTPPAGLNDDTQAVRKAVIAELDAGNDVLVVAHSYGGTPANNALRDLDQRTRRTAGKSTAVKAIAFINAIPIPEGTAFLDVLGGKPGALHDLRTPEFAWVGAPGPEHYFYNEMDSEEAQHWASLLRQQSWQAYVDSTSYAAYMDIPCWYLSCTKDQAFPCEAQKGWIGSLVAAGGNIQMETIDGDHTPFIGKFMPVTSAFIQKIAKTEL